MNYKTFLSENGKYVICEVIGLATQENALEFRGIKSVASCREYPPAVNGCQKCFE